MKQKDNDNSLTEFFIVVIIVSAFLYSVRKDIQDFWNSITSSFRAITHFITSQLFFFILAIVVSAIIIYFIVRLIKTIKRKREEKKIKVEEREKEKKEIEKAKNIKDFDEELERKERINRLEVKEREIDERVKEKERKEFEKEQNQKIILNRLETWRKRVFKKSDLDERQIKALKEDGFQQVNQFDVLERKFIPVFIKPYENMNHSREHIFLVWSVKRLLEHLGIDIIEEHLTKGADITFKYNKKWFALEIETGKLLHAPKQLKEKVNYLNKQYPNRWLFIVSNEKLVSKYADYGLSTPRNRVQENIEKLLKNA